MEDLIVVVIISLTLLILAFMASMINLDFDFTGEGKFPKVKLTFKKDPSLFSFLRKSKIKRKAVQEQKKFEEAEEDYVEKNLFGSVEIHYGKNSETVARRDFTIRALRDDVDKYYYFNSDQKTRVRCIFGFSENSKKLKKIEDLDSWCSSLRTDSFFGSNRVYFPITPMKSGEEKKLSLEFRSKINYQEVLPNYETTSHGYYFRMLKRTEKANFVFRVPRGEFSKICKLILIVQDEKKDLFRKEITEIEDGVFENDKTYGGGWLRIQPHTLLLSWNIPSTLEAGTMCVLEWHNKKALDS
jgi:hypothetical protein